MQFAAALFIIETDKRTTGEDITPLSTIFIGIAGGTGSGKTTLTRHLKEHFGDAVTVIGHDSYYKRQDGKTYEERSKVNYDHPDAFETSLLVEHLKALKAGRSIQCPVYSYVDHNRTDETVEVFPTKVIIVEGILIFQDPTLRDMFDIKIFVETDADVRILRRALRDIRDRGRTLESVITHSTSRPSSPCTSSTLSQAASTRTSSCSRAGTTSSRST